MFFIINKTKIFTMADAVNIFSVKADLSLLETDVIKLFGLSKMTVDNDLKQRDKYEKMVFVEFLELFCRIAEFVYKDSYLHRNSSFIKKI
jgi:hypothetical protein